MRSHRFLDSGWLSGFGLSPSRDSLLLPRLEIQDFDAANIRARQSAREFNAFSDDRSWFSDFLSAVGHSTGAPNDVGDDDPGGDDGAPNDGSPSDPVDDTSGDEPGAGNSAPNDGHSTGTADNVVGDVDLPSIITSDWPDQNVVAFWRDYFAQTHGDLLG